MTRNGGGTIVHVSSANAIVGRKGMAQYDASKNGLLALTRAMACDHADQGIRVNAVCPGPTLTMFHVRRRATQKGISLEQAEAEMRDAGAPTLLKRQAEPREIAYAILFLACEESSYMTGATLMVDGGLSV
jgi:NAD(P)-dependent dehydrogenase (short-subunit alcohol dehydrogenase family)